MRDDLHKKVPRPPKVQTWVKRCLNDADRFSGRSGAALHDAIHDTCNRDISSSFRKNLAEKVSAPTGLFSPLEGINSPRDLGSPGSHLESEVLCRTKRLLEAGVEAKLAVAKAYESALKVSVDADIRATAPVFAAERLSDATAILKHMRSDAAGVDYPAIVEKLCIPQTAFKPIRPRKTIAADENLATGFSGGIR